MLKKTIIGLFALSLALIINACHEPTNPDTPVVNAGFGYITGTVKAKNNTPLNGIEVSVGSLKVLTDSKGNFVISDVPAGQRLLVNFKNDNYAPVQKIAMVAKGRTSNLSATMMAYDVKTLNASAGGTLTTGTASVKFPAGALVDAQGNPFTGTATVKLAYHDPSSTDFIGYFPGEFKGVRTDGSQTDIESYGFMTVNIYNGTQKLNLAASKTATLTMPIAASQQGKAPTTIPLWYYDEAKGQWIEEGSATKTGSTFVGTVGHFSSWNCDQPSQTSYLEGRVYDKSGKPIYFAKVTSIGVDYKGSAFAQTDTNGYFKVAVKSNSTATLRATYFIFSSPDTNFTTPATGQVKDIGIIYIDYDSTGISYITGSVIDNGNLPVKYAFVKLLDSKNKQLDYVSTDVYGKFKFMAVQEKPYTVNIYGANRADTAQPLFTQTLTIPKDQELFDMGTIKIDVGGTTITGRIVDSLGNPVTSKKIYLHTDEFSPSGTNYEQAIDSLGRFSLWVRPKQTIKITVYYMQKSKVFTVDSGELGETKDVGDLKMD